MSSDNAPGNRGAKARKLASLIVGVGFALGALAPSASAAPRVAVVWMHGYNAPGTPAMFNKVGVIEVGSKSAKNVLVLEPGTSAGGGYFVPFAKWAVRTLPGWQVWSVERRENLLEDQSMLNLVKAGKATLQRGFDYYLGFITNPSIKRHINLNLGNVDFARDWGMRVAVEDLHSVIRAAKRLGGRVVLGGHSLGGSVVTAYATWNFSGKAGAQDLAGLVYDDGASSQTPVSAQQAQTSLQNLAAAATPWLTFGGFPAPFAGLYNASGSTAAVLDPNAPSLGYTFSALPAALKPPVPPTNLAQYGYALDTKTSPAALIAAQAHLGQLAKSGTPRGWDSTGALTPITRFAQMFSGTGLTSIDGTEWYFPERLTIDTGAVADGNSNPAQSVLDVRATHGRDLPKRLRIYAFGAALGGGRVTNAATILANQSGIPTHNLTLIDRQSTYAHNDPAGAYPRNAFFAALAPFLTDIARH